MYTEVGIPLLYHSFLYDCVTSLGEMADGEGSPVNIGFIVVHFLCDLYIYGSAQRNARV